MKLTLAKLNEHVTDLLQRHNIAYSFHPYSSVGRIFMREVRIPPIESPTAYAIALHEIGHILGRHQYSRSPAVRERWAWRWARANALQWTPAMEVHKQICLVSYLSRNGVIRRPAPFVFDERDRAELLARHRHRLLSSKAKPKAAHGLPRQDHGKSSNRGSPSADRR
jgi:hypothetical protein